LSVEAEADAGSVVVAFTGSTVAGGVCWLNATPLKHPARTMKLTIILKRILHLLFNSNRDDHPEIVRTSPDE
jgi:hypothetical protein